MEALERRKHQTSLDIVGRSVWLSVKSAHTRSDRNTATASVKWERATQLFRRNQFDATVAFSGIELTVISRPVDNHVMKSQRKPLSNVQQKYNLFAAIVSNYFAYFSYVNSVCMQKKAEQKHGSHESVASIKISRKISYSKVKLRGK